MLLALSGSKNAGMSPGVGAAQEIKSQSVCETASGSCQAMTRRDCCNTGRYS